MALDPTQQMCAGNQLIVNNFFINKHAMPIKIVTIASFDTPGAAQMIASFNETKKQRKLFQNCC